MGPKLLETRPDLDLYLAGFERVPLAPGVDWRLAMFDLRKVRTR